MEHAVRKHPRLQYYDHAAGGTFCVTICTKDRKNILRTVIGEEAEIVLSDLGLLVREVIERIPQVYSVVSLLTVVRSAKAEATRKWGSPVWQRPFYEYIVRTEREALRFWKYVDGNPAKWQLDKYYQ